MVSVFLSFVPFPILKRTERYVQTFDANNISKDGDLGEIAKNCHQVVQFAVVPEHASSG